jgi:hypothetical protein
MPDLLVKQGLERYARGDAEGAVRLWLRVLAATPNHVQARIYLDGVRRASPDMVTRLEHEPVLADAPVVSPPKSAAGQSTATQPPIDGPWAGDATFGPALIVTSERAGLKLVRTPVVAAPEPSSGQLKGTEVATQERRLTECLDLHDFSGALQLAEAILRVAPAHSRAMAVRDECRKNLQAMYLSHLPDIKAVPQVKLEADEIIWLGLDHRAGFVLSQVDGVSNFEEIIEVSGMDQLECLKILAQLTDVGVIGAASAPTLAVH